MAADWVALWWCLAFNVFGGITPSLPIQQTNTTTFSWLLRFLVSEYSFIFYLQLLPTCKISLDANYNHNFNELILRFLDCCCCQGIDKKNTLDKPKRVPFVITYNLASHADFLRGSSRVPAPQIACVADVRGRGEGESAKAGKREKAPYPISPIPPPFSLPPYGPTHFSAC